MGVLLPVAHAAGELDQAAVALEVFGVPRLVHGSDTLLRDVLLTPRTYWYILRHVVSLTVQLIILGIDCCRLEASLAHAAQEMVLMVQLLPGLHRAVSDLLIASAADHRGGHSKEVMELLWCLRKYS